MPDRKSGGAERPPVEGLKESTASYLSAIERYCFDPISPPSSLRITTEARQQAAAERELFAAAARLPESPTPYKYLGVLFLRKEEFEKAGQHLTKSLRRGLTPDALTLFGVARFRSDDTEQARRTFRRAIMTESSYKEAYYNLALTYSYTKHDRAIKLLRKAVEIDPAYAAAHRELGWALKQRRRYSEAERHLRRAADLDESDGWAFVYLGNLMWGRGKPAEAERAYQTAITIWPKEGTPYWCLADFYKEHGRLKTAGSLYMKAARLDPESPVAYSRLGLYFKLIGKPAKAKSYLERALSLDPTFEKVKAALEDLN